MPYLNDFRYEDGRPEEKTIRRTAAKKLAREHGLEFDESTSNVTDLIRMLKSNGIDLSPLIKKGHKLGKNEAATQAIEAVKKENAELASQVADLTEKVTALLTVQAKSAETAEATRAADAGEMPESFDGLTIGRLRQLAKAAGLHCKREDTAEIIKEKLNEHVAAGR